MDVRIVKQNDREAYDKLVTHPVQSWVWGEFRESQGVEMIRLGEYDGDKLVSGLTMTVHPVPLPGFKQTVLNVPRSVVPSVNLLEGVVEEAKKRKAVFAKLEPDYWISDSDKFGWEDKELAIYKDSRLREASNSFAPFSAYIDTTLSDEQLMSNMKSKTRYNLRLAGRKGVKVGVDNSEEAFATYWRLTEETTARQGFYAHDKEYHRLMWQYMHGMGLADLLVARYEGEIVTTWVLFHWHDTLYYPYGASSVKYREVMANNAVMWAGIQEAKKRKAKRFELWGTLGPEADPKHAWYGFHRFKLGFGPETIKFLPTKDVVVDRKIYQPLLLMNQSRKAAMRLKARLRR